MIHEAQIAYRSKMYTDSARQSFERGQAAANGIPHGALPAYPGDGSTTCRCITSPESKVLTGRGWLSLLDVQVGDLVYTHRQRWRPVLALVVKPSAPYHREVLLTGPHRRSVAATDNHLWHTSSGWQNSSDIDKESFLCYHLPMEVGYAKEEDMSKVRYAYGQPEQARPLSVVSVGLSLRDVQRFEGGGMYAVRIQSQGKGSMGESQNTQNHRGCWQGVKEETPHQVGGFGQADMANKIRWPALELVLAGRKRPQGHDVPLSVGMDYGEWSYPKGVRTSSPEQRRIRRPFGKFAFDGERGTRTVAWGHGREQQALVDVPDLPKTLPEVYPAFQVQRPEILFNGLLPHGTAVYDLTVEEDASFVIEGFVAHNTLCACGWIIEDVLDDEGNLLGWNCTWELNVQRVPEVHCPDCPDRAANWAPLWVPA